jgi:hypothetical protein
VAPTTRITIGARRPRGPCRRARPDRRR